MEASRPADPSWSLFDRTIARRRSGWATLAVVGLVFLPTLLAAASLGLWPILSSRATRAVFSTPTVIAYVLIVAPLMAAMEDRVVRSLRPIATVSADEFERLVAASRTVPLRQELTAIALGLAAGVAFVSGMGRLAHWTSYVWSAMALMMFGLLAWTAFVSVTGTRTVAALLRMPLRFDPLDPSPFEAIGRLSLALALVFVGGILIGLFLGNYGAADLTDPRFWLLFLPVSLIPILVFYLNMRPTHRVLASARDRTLADVQAQLRRSFSDLLERMQRGSPTGDLPREIGALVAYEKELQATNTWPYNPPILRTLAVSVLLPLGTLLVRRVVEVYIE
jgi:hypothetical protein